MGLNDDFTASISSDVMLVLTRVGFFGDLDEALCPVVQAQAAAACNGDYTISERLLRAKNFDAEDLDDIFEVLKSRGGFCDCEILYNAVETSRLKATYWRARADGAPAPNPHGGRHQR